MINGFSFLSCITWKIAECSESAGRIFTLCLRARGRTNGPPAISVSLLANAMFFPASIAATVGYEIKNNRIKHLNRHKTRINIVMETKRILNTNIYLQTSTTNYACDYRDTIWMSGNLNE